MAIIDHSLQNLENLEVDEEKVLLSEILESVGVTYAGKKQYSIDTLVPTFECSVLSQSTFNPLSWF